ncbi:hypothetical protein ACFWD7_06415 [Streptomyces mirabilis]|uniref:hypothetical protein n=1 Tax=Streptomyces mirabilis TaxID=68239 RepID=UPI0036AF1D0C
MPSFSTLSDNFNDGVIGPNWGNSYGGANETGGQARVPCVAGSYAGYQTAYSWTFAGSSLFMKVVTAPAASTATEAYCGVMVNAPGIDDGAGPLFGTRVGFTINAVSGMLRMQSDSAYFDPTAVEIAYNATTHAFLRLREDGTNVYWDTSPDGTTWTNRRTLATPAWIPASIDTCALDMSAHRDAGVTDYAAYDLFNTLSDGAVYTGTGTGTAQAAATGTGTHIGIGSASGSAQTAATAAGKAVYNGSGIGSAQTDAIAAASAGPEYPEVAGLSAGDWDLYIEQGSTFVQTYTTSEPADFSWDGWTARAQIRTAAGDTATLLLDLTAYLTVTGPDVRLAIPASITETLNQNGRWDLEMVLGTTVVRLLNGRAVVSPEVTR